MLKTRARTRSTARRLAGAVATTLLFGTAALVADAGPAVAQDPSSSSDQTTNPVEPAVGPQSGGFAVTPAQSPGGVKRSSYDFVVSAGGVQDDAVTVSNLTDQPKTYFMYVANGVTTTSGKIGVLPSDAPKTGATAWLKFGTDLPDGQVTIQPKMAAEIPFRITVPPDATPGDYAFGIAAVPPTARPSPTRGQNKVDIVNAIAVAVQLRVQGPLHPSVRITSLTVNADPPLMPVLVTGETDVSVEVVNDGNQRLPTTVHIVEKNFWGKTIHTEPDRFLPSLLPGSKVTVRARWHKAPLVKGTIEVSVTTDGAAGAASRRTREFWAIPWKLIIALTVITLGAWWYWRKWRKRGREPEVVPAEPEPEPDPEQVSVGTA